MTPCSALSGTVNALHGVVSQKKILFKTTAVKTSNPTSQLNLFSLNNCKKVPNSKTNIPVTIL
jgi:hypothetical protein